jgi:serine protease Do
VVERAEGAAAAAGLQPGDVVLALNNEPITGVDQFRKLLEQAGKRFALLVQRGGSRLFVPVRIG